MAAHKCCDILDELGRLRLLFPILSHIRDLRLSANAAPKKTDEDV